MTNTITDLAPRTARNATPADLYSILQAQRRQLVDLVIPVSKLWVDDGMLILRDVEPVLAADESGFIDPNGAYRFTANADGQLADVLKIPVKYMRRMRDMNVGLIDLNVAGWTNHPEFVDKKVLVRLMWGTDPEYPGTVGIVRSVLSDRYGARDNFDTFVSVLDGMRAAGLSADNLTIVGNLSDDRMSLFVEAPELFIDRPELLGTYHAPPGVGVRETAFTPGRHEFTNDTIHAGIAISNSETGGGAMSITPRIVIRKCMNGWQITKDAFRKVHLGARLDEGAIVWSTATRDAANALAKNQVKDAVAEFLTVDYVQRTIDGIAEDMGVALPKPTETIEAVVQKMAYTADEAESILSDFISGGQVTVGGVVQAITATAQRIEDPERAFDLEASAMAAMEVALATVR